MRHQPQRSSAHQYWLRLNHNIFCKSQRAGSLGSALLSLGQADSAPGNLGRERSELCDDSACFLDDDVLTLERAKAKQPVHRDITEAVRFRLTHTQGELAIVHFDCTIDREFFCRDGLDFLLHANRLFVGDHSRISRGDGFVESPQDAVQHQSPERGQFKIAGAAK